MRGIISNIIKIGTNIRLNLASVSKSMSFSKHFLDSIYDSYVSHHKVIDWRNGCPVFSTIAAPAYSQVQAHQTAMKLMGLFQNRSMPNMVNIAITEKCNCICEHCSFKSIKSNKKEMTTEQIKKIIAESQDLGVSVVNLLGGEPLLRKDIFEIIKSIDKKRSVSLMFTNGWYLAQNAQKLKDSGLDSINISLDSHIPEKHDKIRNAPGLFERATNGIKAAKKAKLTVGISCCISEESINDGTLIKLIEMGKKLKVNEVIIFDAIPTGALADRNDLLKGKDWINRIIEIASKYNKKYDYPGIYPYAYIRSHKSLGCAGGTVFFYISPYGEVYPCDFNPLVLGNAIETPLHIIWDKISNDPHFRCSSWKGCKMQDPSYRKKFQMESRKGARCKRVL